MSQPLKPQFEAYTLITLVATGLVLGKVTMFYRHSVCS